MTIADINKQLQIFINKELQLGQGIEIDENTALIEVGLDSIALMSLLVFVEEHYGFEAEEDVLIGENFNCMGDISRYIHSRIGA